MHLKSVLLGSAMLAACVTSVSATPFGGFGNDTLGPEFVITLNSNGTASIGPGPGSAQGPIDGIEDTYIGVINNTNQVVSQITIHGTDIADGGSFAFDSDGLATFGAGTNGSDTSRATAGQMLFSPTSRAAAASVTMAW